MQIAEIDTVEFSEPIERLTRDERNAAKLMGRSEVRFLVDKYYAMQENRIRTAGQVRSMIDEPNACLSWLARQDLALEKRVGSMLTCWSKENPIAAWAQQIVGIGPIISAGLSAHIDIEKAPTAGHIFRFAGLVDGIVWNKGEKRPWNADLKCLTWKIGQSFMKVRGVSDRTFYGMVYERRKAMEQTRNAAGEFKTQAEKALTAKSYKRVTVAKTEYEAGKLPPGHIDARARRYAVKLFLSHWWEIAYEQHHGREAPSPYAIGVLGHGHYISPEFVIRYEAGEVSQAEAEALL